MARITLVRPPFFKAYGVEKVHFPLAVGYLAAVLEKGGHSVSFVDGEVLDYGLYKGMLYKGIINAALFYADPYFIERRFGVVSSIMEDKDHRVWDIMVDEIAKTSPNIIGISCFTVNMTAVSILADKIKRRLGDIPIVVGGIHPTSEPVNTLEEIPSIDYVVVGEGENTFLELADNIAAPGSPVKDIDGVLRRGQADFKPRALIEDLNSIPFPKRDFYDQSRYIFGAPLLTSRGCMYRCVFCASHVMWTRRVRQRSVDNVIEELKMLKTKFNVGRIRVLDDTFVLNKRWISEFCARLKKERLSLSFNCSGRINTVDEELFKMLSENGFDSIAFGVETGSPRMIGRINKSIDLNKVTSVIKMANRYGFDTTSFYMTGHQGETIEDIRMSEELFKKSASKRGELSMLIPYTGTDVGMEAKKMGFKFGVGDYYKFHHARNRVLFNMTGISDKELLAEHKRFEKIIQRRNYTTMFKKLAKLAMSLGVPKDAIILEDKARNTEENVKFSSEIIRSNRWKDVLLVSSPYNMRRAALVFRKIGGDIEVKYLPVKDSRFYSRPTHGHFMSRKIELSQVLGIIHEYLGIVYYWFKGYI